VKPEKEQGFELQIAYWILHLELEDLLRQVYNSLYPMALLSFEHQQSLDGRVMQSAHLQPGLAVTEGHFLTRFSFSCSALSSPDPQSDLSLGNHYPCLLQVCASLVSVL
jgi:hypothetical protein